MTLRRQNAVRGTTTTVNENHNEGFECTLRERELGRGYGGRSVKRCEGEQSACTATPPICQRDQFVAERPAA